MRQLLVAYMHGAGIETGYGFFAPNVPDNYKLILELHFGDGRVEFALPRVGNEASGVRIVDLLDRLHQIEYPALRELMMQMLASATWRENPDVVSIRAIFGRVTLPSLQAFRREEKESYETLFVYDFKTPAGSGAP